MKTIITTLLFCLSLIASAQNTIALSDFEVLQNTDWKGYLTYKDFQSGELQKVETLVQVQIKGDKIISNTEYNYEPQKNNKSKVKIRKDGRFYGSEEVISNVYKDGVRTVKTTFQGKDNYRKAKFIKIYTFSTTSFQIDKIVQYENEEPFLRNSYNLTKQ